MPSAAENLYIIWKIAHDMLQGYSRSRVPDCRESSNPYVLVIMRPIKLSGKVGWSAIYLKMDIVQQELELCRPEIIVTYIHKEVAQKFMSPVTAWCHSVSSQPWLHGLWLADQGGKDPNWVHEGANLNYGYKIEIGCSGNKAPDRDGSRIQL